MKASASIAVSARSNISVASKYPLIEFLMHVQGAGAADYLYETGNQNLFTNDLIDVNGTTTNYWANRGYWTPAGDHQYVDTNDNVKNFFNLYEIGSAGYCFAAVWQMYFTASTTLLATESILDVGRNASTSGWEIIFSTTRNIVVGYRAEGGGSIANYANLNISGLNNTRVTVGVFIDTQSSQKRVYTMYNADETTIQANDLPGPLPSIASAQGVNFFARGGGAGTVPLGGGGSGVRMADVRYIHLPDGPTLAYQKWLEIVSEMYKYPFEHRLRALAA